MRNCHFDVIVLGGGLVGLTMALLCAQNNLSVALVEAKKPELEWEGSQFDLRVSAITRASQKIFQKLDVWSTMNQQRVSPYHRMEVWDGAGFANIHFDAMEVAEPNLGYIIENRVMIKALWEKAKQNDLIQFFVPGRSSLLSHHKDKVILGIHAEAPTDQILSDKTPTNKTSTDQTSKGQTFTGQTLSASLIVGADGARSWLRETLGIGTKTWDYPQNALVATVTTERSHQNTAWQRFLPEGPLAFLPLSEPNISSIVWTAGKETVAKLLSLNPSAFCDELAHAFDYRLGAVLAVDERQCFPLKMLYAERTIAERVVLIGDAAHVILPLAGQGVNLGFLDADCLANVLGEALRQNRDLGQTNILRRYERHRKPETLMMIGLMEFFNRLFSTDKTTAVLLRGVGVNLLQKTSWVKKKIIRQAMGI